MQTRLACIWLVLVALSFAGATRRSAAEESLGVLTQLPRETLAAVRLSRIDAVDSTLLPLAESFGAQLPALGALVLEINGVDPAGDVVLGLARVGKDANVPFVLLPISNYKQFVRAGDGDAGIPFTPITLGGEELLASQRGRWVLVTNAIDEFDKLGQLDTGIVQQIIELCDDVLLTAFITPAGMTALESIAQSRLESPHRVASRRAKLASRKFDWTNISDWDELLSLHQAMAARFCSECTLLALNVSVSPQQTIRLDIRAKAANSEQNSHGSFALPILALNQQSPVFTAGGGLQSSWAKLAIQLSLDNISSGSEAMGVRYFSTSLFAKFRESAVAACDKVTGVQTLMIAPHQDEPSLSNSAMLLHVGDSAVFLELFDACMIDWNTAVERSSRQEDFVFEVNPLRAGELSGMRYSIDLPSAIRDPNVPEVRDVMALMYGRNGVWAVDVLPIGKNRVLISDLPDKLRDQLVDEIGDAKAQDESSGGWTVRLSPATLQDWRNHVKRQSYGTGIVGWKPKSLSNDSDVVVEIKTTQQQLHITTEIPGELVRAIGKLIDKK